MTDISIWVHGPEFGSSTTQVPIIQAIWKRKPNLNIDFNCVKKNQPIFEYYFSDKIKKKIAKIENIKLIHQLVYKKSMDLSMPRTLAAVTKNFLLNSISLRNQFKKLGYGKKIKLLVSAGLGEVGILPKIIHEKRPRSLYLFNYLVEHYNFFNSNFMNKMIRRDFLKHYSNFDKTVIQTFFPEKDYKIKHELENIKLIPIIARETTKSKNKIRQELGVESNEKLVFLALGGAKFFRGIVKVSEQISKHYPEIKFLLLPRTKEELSKFKNKKNFITQENISFDTQNYVAASDIVVTKCGFGTIAEAIKHKTKIVSIHLPHHAEVTETEIILKKEKIIKNSIDFRNHDIEKEFYKKIISELNNKESLRLMDKIKTNGAQEAAKIYLRNLENGE